MFEVTGKYGTAKIYTDLVEQEAVAQIIGMLNMPFAENANVRIMPDVHAGAGCTIGTTMHIHDKVCPNLVGVDIGCGMAVAKLGNDVTKDDLARLDAALHGYGCDVIVPSGFDIRETPHRLAQNVDLSKLHCAHAVNMDRAYKSVGSVGGGNHFLELDRDADTGEIYLVVHTGSRHLGVEVASYYQKEAARRLSGPSKEQRQEVIDQLKNAGWQIEIPDALKRLAENFPSVNKDLAWCEGDLFDRYIDDMRIAQRFTFWNRRAIIESVLEYMGWAVKDHFETVHNYIDTDNMILRKGAVSARAGEKLIIPMNMRDGSLLCIGKGNPDWNCSAPHGAGRLMSRSAAKQQLSMDEFRDEMSGIYTTSVVQETLDESPMAYKPMQSILENIQDTVDVVAQIKPIYNFKASS